jgi:murein DD-endopeptidase MepM/ murein hydrolase activator NlpD
MGPGYPRDERQNATTTQAPGNRADSPRTVPLRHTPSILAALLVAAALHAAPATADGGGALAPDSASTGAGGGQYGHGAPRGAGRTNRRPRGTLLTAFEVRRPHLFLYGQSARVELTLSGRAAVPVRLHVERAVDRARVATIELGELGAGEHSVPFTGLEAGVLPEGRYLLHVAGRHLRRAASASGTAEIEFSHHAFPIAGSFDWGGEDARFGAKRPGHRHQGQDLTAAEGTPVVAPRGGLVEAVQYQARGAGHYVVVDGEGEDYDYVFMHLRTGSIPVEEGSRVRTGQRLGEVGSTGASSGPHLHFEIWVGGWFAGGEPIEPLPLLQQWASPASG